MFIRLINRFKKKPLPFFLTNIYLSILWNAKIDLSARIYYPFNLRLGKNVHIDKCLIYAEGRGVSFSDNVSIGFSAYINSLKGNISVSKNSSIGPFVVMYGEFGLLIGQDCLIAANSSLIASNHKYANNESLIRKQGTFGQGIVLKNNIWVGCGSIILDGVNLENGCVVGAMSLVKNSFKSNSLIYGSPAKFIKSR